MSADRTVEVLDAGQALDAIGRGMLPERAAAVTGSGTLVVRADGTPDVVELAARTRFLPCVVIGVGDEGACDVAPDLDVLLTADPSAPAPWVGCGEALASVLRLLVDSVDASPHAAGVLAHVLRHGRSLGTESALVLESLAYSTLQGGPTFRRWVEERGPRGERTDDPAVVRCERVGEGLVITLDRPGVRNALDARLREGLVEALQVAAADPSLGPVTVRGAGPSFSSGGDLSEFGTLPDPATAHVVRTVRSPAWWLAQVSERVVAEVHGACVGGGVELAAFASRVVAAPGTTFRLPEVSMGLIPGAGGTVSVTRRVGRQRSAFLALSNLALSADDALTWGLVDEIRP